MAEILIEQAVYHRRDGEMPQLLARSPGFQEDWLAEAEGLVLGFGDRPPGVICPEAVFAHPLGKDQVAVVQVSDQPVWGEGLAAGFHFLIIPRPAYEQIWGDPFALARMLPAPWHARETLPAASLPAEPLPPRTIEEVQKVLKRVKAGALAEDQDPEAEDFHRTPENSESPALLGGTQVLVDGGRLVFERPCSDSGLIPALWTLLPASTRSQLWPASFAFGNALGFDALVVPQIANQDEGNYQGYTSEDQAAEYPPGRYELNLQMAVEAGDQQQLDYLFRRRSWIETWRLGLTLLLLVFLLALTSRILVGPPANPPQPPPQQTQEKP